MKKFYLALVCALLCSVAAFAQKGQSAVGINLGYGIGLDEPKPKNFELGVKYQYNISDPIRLEAAFNYGLKDKEVEFMTYGINAHYLFNVAESFKLYPIVGLGAATAKIFGESETKFMVQGGLGGEYAIGEHFAINLEVKYQYSTFTDGFSRIPVTLGFAYKF